MQSTPEMEAAFARVRSSYTDLVEAEKNLKKARLRVKIVRTAEKIIVAVTVYQIYKHATKTKKS